MNLFESFLTLTEARETQEKVKNTGLYRAIDPARAREIGTSERKREVETAASNAKLSSETKTLAKTIEALKVGGGMKIQRHISLPAALYLVQKKEKLSGENKETIIKAQKDYFYKDFPKKEKSSGELQKKIISALGNMSDVSSREIAFVNFYRDTINKVLTASNFSAIEDLLKIAEIDTSETTPDQKSAYLARLKKNLKPYKDNEILDKLRFWRNDLKKLNSINDVQTIARKAVFDDELGAHRSAKGIADATSKNIKGRKEEKRATAIEKKRSGAELTPEEQKRALGGKGERAAKLKKKIESIKNLFEKAKEMREVVFSLYNISGKDLPEGMIKKDDMQEKKLKELLRSAGYKWGRDTAEGMWWNLQRRIEKNKEQKKSEEAPKPKESDIAKREAKQRAYSDYLEKRAAELKELEELMTSTYSESVDEKQDLIKKVLFETL
jgi:hypothetical protein